MSTITLVTCDRCGTSIPVEAAASWMFDETAYYACLDRVACERARHPNGLTSLPLTHVCRLCPRHAELIGATVVTAIYRCEQAHITSVDIRHAGLPLTARATLDRLTDALFALNHESKTAYLLHTFCNTACSSPYIGGVTAKIEPFVDVNDPKTLAGKGLRLMSHPFNTTHLYTIT